MRPTGPEEPATFEARERPGGPLVDHGRELLPGPGVARTARITQPVFLGYRLAKPLDVTCSAAIEPTSFRRWKLTLRDDWAATSAHPAGHAEFVVLLLDPDRSEPEGQVAWAGDAFGIAQMPGRSRIPDGEKG